jgi:hypothetical protein
VELQLELYMTFYVLSNASLDNLDCSIDRLYIWYKH